MHPISVFLVRSFYIVVQCQNLGFVNVFKCSFNHSQPPVCLLDLYFQVVSVSFPSLADTTVCCCLYPFPGRSLQLYWILSRCPQNTKNQYSLHLDLLNLSSRFSYHDDRFSMSDCRLFISSSVFTDVQFLYRLQKVQQGSQ